MLWVIVFVAIAVAGLIMTVCYGVWLAHKTADLLSEVAVLSDRGAQLADMLGQIGAATAATAPDDAEDSFTPAGPMLPAGGDVR